jgi:hypothetical protein
LADGISQFIQSLVIQALNELPSNTSSDNITEQGIQHVSNIIEQLQVAAIFAQGKVLVTIQELIATLQSSCKIPELIAKSFRRDNLYIYKSYNYTFFFSVPSGNNASFPSRKQ